MKETSATQAGELVSYYWNAYFEWRASFSIQDDCMLELARAIRAEIDAGVAPNDDAARLMKLALMIETEVSVHPLQYRA
jgi:hypothetical protein